VHSSPTAPIHPVLRWCAANAIAVRDPAGNRKLDKSKATGRIDGMVALAMAVSVAVTDTPKPPDVVSYTRGSMFA
jgi:phage terminase large subunit-like protein